jgi:hypothetical protein
MNLPIKNSTSFTFWRILVGIGKSGKRRDATVVAEKAGAHRAQISTG